MSSIIYHGIGTSSEVPILFQFSARKLFDVGPKISEIREALSILRNSMVGKDKIYGVIGPLDEMKPVASDALLKSLEEMPSDRFLVLWAKDEARVRPTIRSRLRMEYIPPSSERDINEEALELLEAYLRRDVCSVAELSRNDEIISDLILVLSRNWDLNLWVKLRLAMKDKHFDAECLLSLMLDEMENQ